MHQGCTSDQVKNVEEQLHKSTDKIKALKNHLNKGKKLIILTNNLKSYLMQTVTIDIINNKAVKLLQDLELLQLIRVHKEKQAPADSIDWVAKYKGAMTKRPLNEIENQLNELRNEWE